MMVAVRKKRVAFRLQLSEKLMDLGNLVAGALLLGQFISDKEFSMSLFVVGAFLMGACYGASFLVSR